MVVKYKSFPILHSFIILGQGTIFWPKGGVATDRCFFSVILHDRISLDHR